MQLPHATTLMQAQALTTHKHLPLPSHRGWEGNRGRQPQGSPISWGGAHSPPKTHLELFSRSQNRLRLHCLPRAEKETRSLAFPAPHHAYPKLFCLPHLLQHGRNQRLMVSDIQSPCCPQLFLSRLQNAGHGWGSAEGRWELIITGLVSPLRAGRESPRTDTNTRGLEQPYIL